MPMAVEYPAYSCKYKLGDIVTNWHYSIVIDTIRYITYNKRRVEVIYKGTKVNSLGKKHKSGTRLEVYERDIK